MAGGDVCSYRDLKVYDDAVSIGLDEYSQLSKAIDKESDKVCVSLVCACVLDIFS